MAKQEQRSHRRKIIYIHRTFQRNFIIKFCIIAALGMVSASLLLYIVSKDSLTATYRYHHLAVKTTAEAILPGLVITNLVVLLALIVASVFVTLYISHKIAGPLYRLNKSLQAIGEGDLTMNIRLRQKDQLMEFASTINTMVENLRERIEEIETMIRELKAKTALPTYDHTSLRHHIEKIESKMGELFKTEKKG
jgi:methyl-accepting chemotaxis protein